MLSTWKIEKVSQNCFAFDVAKFKNWESLPELLRFGCCQDQKLRKSRRIVSFSSLQIDSYNYNYYYNYEYMYIYTTLIYATLHYTNYTTLH